MPGFRMLIDQLFEQFDNYQNLWIDINDIRDAIKQLGAQDDIRFHYVDIDTDIVRGFLHQYTRRSAPYAEPMLISDIYIGKDLDENWQRLVAAKELLHILDVDGTRAQSNTAVDTLFKNLSLPAELRTFTQSTFNDQARLFSAVAILVPRECRAILRRMHSEGKITAQEVSQMAKIPQGFGSVILEDDFEQTFAAIHSAGNGI